MMAVSMRHFTTLSKFKMDRMVCNGVNILPLDYIADHGILLTNGKGVQAKQLSEYILAFILDDYKR